MKLEVVADPSRDEWDSVLRESGSGDYRKSYQYGEYARVSESSGVMRLLARSDRALGIMQGVYGRKPFSRLLLGGSSGGGPVVVRVSGREAEEVGSLLVSRAGEFARRRLIASQRLHRFVREGLIDALTGSLGFSLSRHSSIFTVPLDPDSEKAWARLDSPKRRNVRKARKSGLAVRWSQDGSDIDTFYDIFRDFSRKESFDAFPKSRVSSMMKAFAPDGMIRVFVAESGGDPVASALVLNHLDTAFCPYTCSFEEARELRANDLLHWEIIRWGCGQGLSRYNMGEVFPYPESEEYGLYRWKRGFGGYLDKMVILERNLLPIVGRVRASLRR